MDHFNIFTILNRLKSKEDIFRNMNKLIRIERQKVNQRMIHKKIRLKEIAMEIKQEEVQTDKYETWAV
jgi:hypothetical protein